MLRPAIAALLVSATAVQAQDGSLSAYLEVIKPDRLMARAMQVGIMALRTQADVVYEALSVNVTAGEASLTGLDLWPLPEWDEAVECRISADRIALASAPLADLDRMALRISVTGASVTGACLPPDQREPLEMAGLEDLVVPLLTLDIRYDIPSSSLSASAHAEVEGLATLDATGDLAYAWLDAREDPDNPVPVLFLSEARLTVENDGGWDALKALLPPPATTPGNARLIAQGAVGSIIAEMNADAGGLRGDSEAAELSPEQLAFAEAAAAAWDAFVASPERLVLETRIDEDIYVDIDAYIADPRDLFADLSPTVSNASAKALGALGADLVRRAIEEPAALSGEERRRAGIALLTGEGAPRDRARGIELLAQIGQAGDGEVALMLARAQDGVDDPDAYFYALTAGASGIEGATGLIDRIEGRLDLEDVVAVQSEVAGTVTGDEEADLTDLASIREAALSHLTGVGNARSYELASYWARLGAALGDEASADMLSQIDARTAGAGFDEAEARAAGAATKAWLSR